MINAVVQNVDATVTHDENGDALLDCHIPARILYDGSIPLYYLFDSEGSTIEKIEIEDMPLKWRKIFEGDLS